MIDSHRLKPDQTFALVDGAIWAYDLANDKHISIQHNDEIMFLYYASLRPPQSSFFDPMPLTGIFLHVRTKTIVAMRLFKLIEHFQEVR